MLLATVAAFAAIMGVILGVEQLFGCDINGGSSACLALGVDLNGPLTTLALIGGFGLFLLSPLLVGLALIMLVVCTIRRSW
jgi:hypothetical protein